MRTRLSGKVTLLFMTLGLLLAIPAIALADNVQNDVVAGGNDTITAGGSTTINYRITANNGDGQTGCNAADASSATVTINTPTGVTATPGSLTFTSCGTTQPVAFSSNTPGTYAITASVSDSGSGTYNTNPANFTLHVNAAPPPSDTTPPDIGYVLDPASPNGNNGWYNSGNISLTWTVTESESPSSLIKTGCVDQNITADQAATTYSCSATSDGGSAGPVNVSVKRDATAPTVAVNGFENGAVFTKGDTLPTVSCNVEDTLSEPVNASPTPAVTDNRNSNGVGSVTYTCTGADNAGNTASASKTLSVIYDFAGFFRPIDNLPVLNSVKAGSAIPVKFSLGGNQGLNIFSTGSPASQKINCDTSATVDQIEETITAGGSTLSYDASIDQYNYVWKSDKSWAGTCRQLSVTLNDGEVYKANFKFLK